MQIEHKKKTAYYLAFPAVSTSTPESFATGLSPVDTAYSKDGAGAWTTLSITDTASEIASTGVYEIDLTATEMDHDQVMIKFAVSGMADTAFLFDMRDSVQYATTSSTADSGSTSTLVDAARTEADTDYWQGYWIRFTSGNLAGQVRLCTAFNPATDTLTFEPNATQAVGTHEYELIPAGEIDAVNTVTTTTNTTNVTSAVTVGTINANVITATSIASDAITNAKIANDAIGATEIANGAIDAATFAANAINAAAIDADAIDLIWDEPMAGHVTADTSGEVMNDWQDGGRLDLILDARMPTTHINATGGAVDTVTTVTNDVGITTTAVDNIWDEDIVAAHGTADTAGLIVSQLTQRSVTLSTEVDLNSIIGQLLDDGTAWSYDRTADSLEVISQAAGLTEQQVRDAMKLAPTGGAPAAGSVDEHLDDILADTNELQADWVNGGRLDNILDARMPTTHINATAGAVDTVTTATNVTTVTNAVTVGTMDANTLTASALATDAVDEIRDSIWNADATDHQTQGTFGQAIGDPGTDPSTIWGTIETRLDVLVSSRMAETSISTTGGAIDTVTAVTNDVGITTTAVGNIWDEPMAPHVTADSAAVALKDVLSDTTTLHDTRIPDTISLANINTEVDTGLSDIHLDHLFAVDYDPASPPGIATALLNELVQDDGGGITEFTVGALANAPVAGGNITQIMGTNLTETNSGDLADNFSQFYDVDPTTTNTVDDVGGGGGGGGDATLANQTDIMGIGFVSATHSLVQISTDINDLLTATGDQTVDSIEAAFDTAQNLSMTAQRDSDGWYWNDTSGMFEAAPAFADREILMTEGTGEYVGVYSAPFSTPIDLGTEGSLRLFFHDKDDSDTVVATARLTDARGIARVDTSALASDLSSQLSAGASIQVVSAVGMGGELNLIIGNDYLTSEGTDLQFIVPTTDTVVGHTLAMEVRESRTGDIVFSGVPGTLTIAGSIETMHFDVPREMTNLMTVGGLSYMVEATSAGGNIKTVVEGSGLARSPNG